MSNIYPLAFTAAVAVSAMASQAGITAIPSADELIKVLGTGGPWIVGGFFVFREVWPWLRTYMDKRLAAQLEAAEAAAKFARDQSVADTRQQAEWIASISAVTETNKSIMALVESVATRMEHFELALEKIISRLGG
jgi:hypothetical protein